MSRGNTSDVTSSLSATDLAALSGGIDRLSLSPPCQRHPNASYFLRGIAHGISPLLILRYSARTQAQLHPRSRSGVIPAKEAHPLWSIDLRSARADLVDG